MLQLTVSQLPVRESCSTLSVRQSMIGVLSSGDFIKGWAPGKLSD